MAGDKFLYLNSGVPSEKAANTSSAGASDAGKIVALDNTGRLDTSLLPTGIAADTASITATEALAAGDFVNVYNSTGAKCRKADASTAGKEAHGFVVAAVEQNATATVYFEGRNNQVSTATPGPVYLSASVPGGFTSTAPSSTGNVVQRIGVAVSATEINFESGQVYVLA